MDGRAASDSDKLPWLEPYRDTPPRRSARSKPKSSRSFAMPLLALLLAGLLGLGGYWLGRGDVPRSTVTAPLPSSGDVPVRLPYRTLDERLTDNMVTIVPEEALPSAGIAAPSTPSSVRPKRASTSGGAAKPQVRRPAPARQVAARPAPPAPVRGETLYLGTFASPRLANAAYRRVTRRYPYLATLPKTVMPVSRGPGQPRAYQLRLKTGSPANAQALCRNLILIGRGCGVI